jgi:hypothetical protein
MENDNGLETRGGQARRECAGILVSKESVVAQPNQDEKGSVAQRLEAEHLKRMLLARDRLRQARMGAAA